jgi:hypothetical protein
MPIRLGEVLILAIIGLTMVMLFRGKRPTRETARRMQVSPVEDPIVAAVVESQPVATVVEDAVASPSQAIPNPGTATITVANVAGRGVLFRCEEHREGSTVETRVCRINRGGKPIGETCVYREPLREVIASLTTVAA